MNNAAARLEKATHRAIAAVTEETERMHFNKAVAQIRELTNAITDCKDIGKAADWARRFGIETVAQLIGPMMPHLAEEMWILLGKDGLLAEQPWPTFDPALLEDDTVTVVVQVNGKLRAKLELAKNLRQADAETIALAHDTVQRAIGIATVRRVIIVPNKIINIVTK
jgi:leucyl-tRNA synthetase